MKFIANILIAVAVLIAGSLAWAQSSPEAQAPVQPAPPH